MQYPVGDGAAPLDTLTKLLPRFSRPGVSKHLALYEAVMHAAASGTIAPGTRLPNEKDLADNLPLSLGTIQRALRRLAEDRVIERRQGMGSFILDHSHVEMEQPFHCRFLDDTGHGYLPVFPVVLSRTTVRGPGHWSTHLGIETALRIVRRAQIGDEFAVYCSVYFDPVRLPVFSTLPLDQLDAANFKQVIFQATGQQVDRVDTLVRQVRPAKEICEQIGVGRDQSCLELCAHAFLGMTSPVYTQVIVVPPTTRQVHMVSNSRALTFPGAPTGS